MLEGLPPLSSEVRWLDVCIIPSIGIGAEIPFAKERAVGDRSFCVGREDIDVPGVREIVVSERD